MKVITTNLLNRFWKKGIAPLQEEIRNKLDTSKIIPNTKISESGKVMDGKTASEEFAKLNSKLTDMNVEFSMATYSGFFESPIRLIRRGREAEIRLNSKVGWSFSAEKDTKIADLPDDYIPKWDTKSTLYRGAVPIGYVEVRTTGLYITSSAASDIDSFWNFDIQYWLP